MPFLDAVLHHIKRPIYMPSYDTFTSPDSFKLNEDPGKMHDIFMFTLKLFLKAVSGFRVEYLGIYPLKLLTANFQCKEIKICLVW